MESQKSNNTDSKSKNEAKKQKQKQNKNKKPKFNIKIIKKSFKMPPQPENYKQIYQVYDTGKRELVDYSGNKQECDIFGFPIKKYYNNISGISDFKLRLSKDLIKELKYNNKSLYMPITSKFEGTTMFPRPLSLPFVNQDIHPFKLIQELKKEKRISEAKNKTILSLNEPLKDNEAIPNFICQKLAKENSTDSKYIMRLINKYINKKKQEHKYQLDFENKNKEIKALKEYKKTLSENLGNKFYNGKIISECKQEDIKEKYETIRKLIYNQDYKNKDIKNNTLVNYNSFSKLKSLKRIGTMNNFYKHDEILIKNKSCTNIFGNNKFLFQNKDDDNDPQKDEINKSMIKTYSIFSNANKNKGNEKIVRESNSVLSSLENKKYNNPSLKSTKSCMFINNFRNGINLKYNINLYTPNKRIIVSENKNKTSINFFTNSDSSKKQELEKINNNTKDNYSFISDEKLNQNNIIFGFQNGYNYRTIKALKTISDKERELLKGFKTTIEEEKASIKYASFDKKEQTLEHYLKEMKLLEKVNKRHFEKERKENLFKDNILKKKIEGKKIFEKNFRKIHFK